MVKFGFTGTKLWCIGTKHQDRSNLRGWAQQGDWTAETDWRLQVIIAQFAISKRCQQSGSESKLVFCNLSFCIFFLFCLHGCKAGVSLTGWLISRGCADEK